MRQPYTQLYLHLVWATWDRMALIRPDLRQPIYGCIADQLKKHRCDPLAIGGIADHVHVLLRFPTTARVCEVVQHAKGASSHMVTHELDPGGFFKWQAYYGAFTLGKRHVPAVHNYVLRQEEHHLGGTTNDALERIFEDEDHTLRPEQSAKADFVPL